MNIILKDNNDDLNILMEGGSIIKVYETLKKMLPEYKTVDMGLPSGTLWADCNVGANSSEEAGLFFQWGDVEGFSKDSGRYCSGTRNGERDWSGDYARTHGSELGDSQNIPTDPYFDAARKYMGSPWRMPTTAEIQELFNEQYTTNAWVTNYKGSGMNGRLVTSKANGNTLFFPAAGYFGGGFSDFGSYGDYWSSSFNGEESAYYLDFYSGDVYPDSDGNRYCGFSVRGVYEGEVSPTVFNREIEAGETTKALVDKTGKVLIFVTTSEDGYVMIYHTDSQDYSTSGTNGFNYFIQQWGQKIVTYNFQNNQNNIITIDDVEYTFTAQNNRYILSPVAGTYNG